MKKFQTRKKIEEMSEKVETSEKQINQRAKKKRKRMKTYKKKNDEKKTIANRILLEVRMHNI